MDKNLLEEEVFSDNNQLAVQLPIPLTQLQIQLVQHLVVLSLVALHPLQQQDFSQLQSQQEMEAYLLKVDQTLHHQQEDLPQNQPVQQEDYSLEYQKQRTANQLLLHL